MRNYISFKVMKWLIDTRLKYKKYSDLQFAVLQPDKYFFMHNYYELRKKLLKPKLGALDWLNERL